ncbi:hypothetical protein XM38_012410 [Halomicronema hongdechloris C2206]|uniref:Uncharacterized protein n=1 Tax=Halomicronema hongdechloris C2206 TaxID=1641165 RepID=A0A1Z3HJ09_9CYAN|nr:hypothetical protein [Halomicronema hongdechloris]ASC70304.1 hypothetical protein XM38_012410 [Halomicronema hongdechloris C2206]
MQLIEIRRRLEDLTEFGAPAPSPSEWAALKRAWATLKPQTLPSYHPVIDDRIALVESLHR